jgi:prepilin-type N-terminal cleavage/methylation domain-containing protein
MKWRKMLRSRFLRRRRSAHGFALLEVMVCLAVLAIAIPMFLTAIARNTQLEQMNAETNVATGAAGSVIENVHSLT